MKLHIMRAIHVLITVLFLSACIPPPPATPTVIGPTIEQQGIVSSPTETIIDTIEPTLEPTSPPIPPPIECKHPAVTQNVFSQLENVNGQFPFYGEPNDPNFLCQGVYDRFHTEPLSVRIEYKNVDTNYGFWGVATPDGYDALQFSQLCFWAYAENPNQAFRLKLRDTNDVEMGVVINLDEAGRWINICTPLSKFTEQGVSIGALINVNLGFEEPTGSAIIWADDFEFK
ncbi:MAG TPA: hypothetical protein VMN99_13550 [Anaerolineales bacterium]|nr:hypothetical protein [Anaerolineales bacterium]